MENLKFKSNCEKFNLYTAEDLPQIYFKDQVLSGTTFNYTEKINSSKLLIDDPILNKFKPVILFETRKQYKYNSEQVELYYIEHVFTALATPENNIALLCKDYKTKKYYLMPHYAYYREAQNFEHYARNEAKKKSGLNEPNKIGVFTERKISDWLEYVDQEINFLNDFVEISTDKNAKIESEINKYIELLEGTVQRWGENTEIQKNCFRIIFNHDKKSQYMTIDIKYDGNIQDVLNIVNR